MNYFDDSSESYEDSYYYSSYHFYPFDLGKDLIRTALRFLKDKNELIMDEDAFFIEYANEAPDVARSPPGLFKRLLRRFILGLPMVGAISVVQILLSAMPIFSPMNWITRYRGNRNRRGDTRDVAVMVVIALLLFGILRLSLLSA